MVQNFQFHGNLREFPELVGTPHIDLALRPLPPSRSSCIDQPARAVTRSTRTCYRKCLHRHVVPHTSARQWSDTNH
jgi:hypothetical protein